MIEEISSKEMQRSLEREIDILSMIKTLWKERKTVLRTTLIFMVIGLFIAIFTPKEYTASTTIVPATMGKSISGGLGGLAAMAGINLGGMNSESGIPPTLYPQIISSISFQKELLQTPLNFEGQNKPITYEDYYTNYFNPGLIGTIKKYTIGLPGQIIKSIKGNTTSVISSSTSVSKIITTTYEESILIEQLSDQLLLDNKSKDGYVSLSVNMSEPLIAAEMAQRAQKLLQQYIIDFKIQKSSEKLKFIMDRYAEKKIEFKKAQQELAHFQDENQSVNSALAKINLMKLQTDYDLAYGVYFELAKQLETQLIQVKQDTPVFTVIKPVSVPLKKSKPNRPMILVVSSFIGVLIGIGMVFGRLYMKRMKEKLNESVEF